MDLWFWHSPLGPSVIPFAPTPPPRAKSLPLPGSQDPSAELQPTCWIQGQLGFRCHNKNHSGLLMMRLSPLSFDLPVIFLYQYFFISFAVNFSVALSFPPASFVVSDVFGVLMEVILCASVIWEVLRDMSSLGCRPAGALSHQSLCSLIYGTDACHANVPKLSRHNRTLVINCDLRVKTSDCEHCGNTNCTTNVQH